MDARERLRAYLEQRRELGESELVLDQMTVEEVMAIVGAKAAVAPGSPSGSPSAGAPGSSPRVAETEGDWREALRAAGAEAPKPQPQRPPAADAPTPKAAKPAEPAVTAEPERGHKFPVPDGPATPVVPAPAGIVAGGTRIVPVPGISDAASLAELEKLIASCQRCPLYSTAINPVPGEGNPNADFMCVGEAPGQNEDETGRPFIGAAGQLLTKILAAIDLRREDVFIANVLKHRPPGNRNPLPDEVTACSPYLIRQIELVKPKVILALGTFAAQTLLETKLAIGKLRGQEHRYHGVPLVVTYHPAALLRNSAWKRPTWEDVQLARRILDRASTGA